jgi:hypothetical protein
MPPQPAVDLARFVRFASARSLRSLGGWFVVLDGPWWPPEGAMPTALEEI